MNSQVLRGVPRVLGAAALFGALLAAPAVAAPSDEVVGEACAGEEGVTVVVDFTDSGGDIEVGCAEGTPEDGRAALEGAGFTSEDSQPGMICAINSSPDPCPEEFDGNFWSYWFDGEDGEWETYMVGLDEAEPAPGSVEGWRYSDGSEGPQVSPAALLGDSGDASDETPTTDEDAGSSSSMTIWIVVIVAVVVGGTVTVFAGAGARKRKQR